MTEIQERLFSMQDKEYAKLQTKLTPGLDESNVIGVRVPDVKKYAKELSGTPEARNFMRSLPHEYFDEDMLHGKLISVMTNYNRCLKYTEAFLPYVTNWAVCDTMSPKIFGKYKDDFISRAVKWAQSEHNYTCRFGIEMLMTFYLDDAFKPEYLEIPASIVSEDYYVNMMIAWYFATALAKQWSAAVPYIEEGRLSVWVHNKTIQKAIESYRITDKQKNYLRQLKR